MPRDLFRPLTEKRIQARDTALTAALSVIITERAIGTDEKAVGALTDVWEMFELACRDVANAVDDAPPHTRPRAWSDEDGRTA